MKIPKLLRKADNKACEDDVLCVLPPLGYVGSVGGVYIDIHLGLMPRKNSLKPKNIVLNITAAVICVYVYMCICVYVFSYVVKTLFTT